MRRCGTTFAVMWLSAALGAAHAIGAPSTEMSEAATRDGNAMYEAFRKGHLEEFVSYTYPALVEQMGGKEEMIADLKKGRADMADNGFRFVSGTVAPPIQIVQAGSQLHAVLPLRQILAAPRGELHVAGHLLGVSSDGGKTWTFIDTVEMTPDNVRQVLPDFNPELELPPKTEPQFVPKK